MTIPTLSVVIPVYNEEAVLPELFARLYPALDAIAESGTSYEVIFINDGSKDRSPALLLDQQSKRPDVTRIVLFSGNFGQHAAIMAGFAQLRGEVAVTLDADLQNPPEEIHKLLTAYRARARLCRLDSRFAAWRCMVAWRSIQDAECHSRTHD